MSNFMFENPYFIIIGWWYENVKKLKLDFKKIEWKEEEVEF